MIRRVLPGLWVFLLACLSAGLAAGCNKKEDPSPRPDGGAERKEVERKAPSLADEDPALVDHAKKKNWLLIQDRRLADNSPMIVLMLDEKVTLTPDDFKLLAKAKTIQAIDAYQAKNLTDDGVRAMAGIATLENVAVGGDELTDAGVKALAQCKSLEVVTIRSAKKVSGAGIKELAALPKLKALWIQFMEFDGAALAAFAGSKTLQTVNFDYVEGVTDAGIAHLAKLPNLKELRLDTRKDHLTSAGIKAIVDVRLPDKLKFSDSLIDDDLFETLVAKGWLYGPSHLTESGDKGPATAADVSSISLRGSKVTDKGFQKVLNCTNVTHYFLKDNSAIGDATFKKLGHFKKLEYLSLEGTKLGNEGFQELLKLPSLKELYVDYTQVTNAAREKAEKDYPKVKFSR